MPSALRNRTSRNGTPLAVPQDTSAPPPGARKEKAQSSLDSWIEPPPKNPAPSFEEHGFARHGVLETMAPLGALPSARAKHRARTIGEPATRRSLLGKNGNMMVDEDGVTTPEVTPVPDLEREDEERQEESEAQADVTMQDEDEDDDYIPSKSMATSRAIKTPVRGKTPVTNRTPTRVKTPIKNGMGKTAAALRSPATQVTPLSAHEIASRQRIHTAVNDAILRSKTHMKPKIGMAIKQMYEASQTDPTLLRVLDSIMHQNATREQMHGFRTFIKSAKKRISKQEPKISESSTPFHQAQAVFTDSPGPTDAKFTSTMDTKSSPPTPSRTYTPIDLAADDASPFHDTSKVPDSPESLSVPVKGSPVISGSQSPSPRDSQLASTPPQKQPLPALVTDPISPPEGPPDADQEASTLAPTPADKSPVSPNVSDADELSDVDEDVLNRGSPEVAAVNGNVTPPMAKRGKGATRGRGGRKLQLSRANSLKPAGKGHKHQPPNPNDEAQQRELRAKRDALAEQQLSRLDFNTPLSDIRFEDEKLETESLTESQFAIGPPMKSEDSRPKRSTRTSRNGHLILHLPGASNTGKRLRDEDSAGPSPRPGSAATSRPTTPALLPPSKRLKLTNGQAARTKRSPVKNRDNQPIAGIAHQGGAVRQKSAPDDNEPDSPCSDSDDFCSACQGTGEFVICEGCPRVFHFMCLDPPLQEAPEGSFLCHECTTRHIAREEAPAESFTPMGLLMKTLDGTNPRAFALPAHIQNYFDGVEAKQDGSYSEPIKRIPLPKSGGYGYQRPDYLKTHDANHKIVLCAQCGMSSGGKRQLIQCDYCPCSWHLDCLDPPLANPPQIGFDASHRDAWKCPRHIDHDLRSGQVRQKDLNDESDADMPGLYAGLVKRKVRKPKNAEIAEPLFTRSNRNNGLIEVINNSDDDTDGEGNYIYPPIDDSKSKVYRVPEKGIVLDFIAKIKTGRIEKMRQQKHVAKAASKAAAQRTASLAALASRPLEQQQMAVELARFANKEKDIGLSEDNLSSLYLRLTAEAPENVLSLDAAERKALTRAELLKLQELVSRALATV